MDSVLARLTIVVAIVTVLRVTILTILLPEVVSIIIDLVSL
jgi:hypothetical protein